jgi:hypothetical protein
MRHVLRTRGRTRHRPAPAPWSAMRRAVRWLTVSAAALLALSLGGCAATTVASTPVSPSELPTLAGFWTGYFVGTSGAASPADITIQPDGRYALVCPGGTTMEGRISVTHGQLVLNNDYLSGPAVDEAVATATLALHQKGKRQQLVGFGENDAGPFSFSFGR